MALGPGLTFKAFLRGRQPTTRLKQEYAALVKSRTPQPTMPPSGRTPADTPPVRSSGTTPSAVGSGTRTNGSRIRTNPRFDTRGVQVNPSRIRTESYTPPAPNTVPRMAANNPMRTINGAMPQSPTPPSGGGERLVDGKTFAERVAANAAKRGAPPPSKIAQLGKAVGKVARPVMSVMNSPAGKMAGRVGVAYYGAKTAGDLFGLAEPYIDMARYGHKLPYKDGVGGRDNRLNDVLGNIPFNVREAMSPGQTQRDLSKLTGGVSDKVFKTLFPYRERPTPTAATQKPNQAPKKPEGVGKPIGAAPKQPDSLRGIGEQARGQSKALRSPDDYLGSAFDATLRKGIDTGRNYLRSQMNKDGLDSDQQSKIMARFNDKIAGDKELSKAANKGGIVNTIEAKDPGRGQRTLEAYRGQRGAYQGNTSYKAMQEKYVK